MPTDTSTSRPPSTQRWVKTGHKTRLLQKTQKRQPSHCKKRSNLCPDSSNVPIVTPAMHETRLNGPPPQYPIEGERSVKSPNPSTWQSLPLLFFARLAQTIAFDAHTING
ncbi:hypothetical protein VFPPC_17378 [Pochonia chlamydosporia 170]|uniref:Uncharacterized protein n=1 Tax=Pochonia chlamydosporia 170 TaxID=1380566 RepID=A0A219ARS7_METCM|nr:hypothetical protein VFPPC_17378 [Pochonia chlamydosporia 170]OWT43473.1 hypothetical protein VFPPC_17378 [Pochonia chlamydosporia 170]